MYAFDFVKELGKMCSSFIDCEKCPLETKQCHPDTFIKCDDSEIEEIIRAVELYSKQRREVK